MTKILQSNHMHPVVILITGIVLSGITIRLFGVGDGFGWWGDVAADHLMARHIVRFHEFPLIGHPATGLGTELYYPPYFYYLLALVMAIVGDNAVAIASVFSFVHGLSSVAMGIVGLLWFGPWAAGVASAIYALSPRLVEISFITTPPFFAVSLIPWILLLYTRALQAGWGSGSRFLIYAFLILMTTLYYGIFVCLPFAIFFEMTRQKTWILRAQALAICIGIGLVVYWPVLWYSGIGAFVSSFVPTLGHASVQPVTRVAWTSIVDFFGYNPTPATIYIGAMALFFLCSIVVGAWKHRAMLLLGSLIVTYGLVLMVVQTGLFEHSLHIAKPLWILLIAGGVHFIAESTMSRYARFVCMSVALAVVTFHLIPLDRPSYSHEQYDMFANAAREVATHVDAQGWNRQYRVYAKTPQSDTNDTLALIDALERTTHMPHVRLNQDTSMLQQDPTATGTIVVCMKYGTREEADECLDSFHSLFPVYRELARLESAPNARIGVYHYEPSTGVKSRGVL